MVDEHAAEPRWVPVADAARRLGITENAIRRRINAGTIPTRREVVGNRGRTLVRIDSPPPAESEPNAATTLAQQVRHLEVQLARAEERLAAADELKAELRRQLDQARADLGRERRRAEEAERRQAEQERRQVEQERRLDDILRELGELHEERRRPWPGVRRWWRRFVEGEG